MARRMQAGEMEALRLSEGKPADPLGGADTALSDRARHGDTAAFEELYRRHRDRMYTLCVNLCGDREQAEDLLQETFVRAYRALPRFRGRSRFSTWLHRIAVNVCRDAARWRRRHPEVAAVPESGPPESGDTIMQVRAALVRLRPQHRAVLALRYSQSLSYQEIAETLDWSLGRVKVTIHRAKRAFKEVYVQLCEAEP